MTLDLGQIVRVLVLDMLVAQALKLLCRGDFDPEIAARTEPVDRRHHEHLGSR
jgi:hypothetical protein